MTGWLLFAWLCVNIGFLIVNVKTFGAIQRSYARVKDYERQAKERLARIDVMYAESEIFVVDARKVKARLLRQVVNYGLTAHRLN